MRNAGTSGTSSGVPALAAAGAAPPVVPGTRRDGRAEGGESGLADLDRVARRRQAQRLVRRPARFAIHEELRVGGLRTHDHVAEDRREREFHRGAPACSHRHFPRSKLVTLARDGHHLGEVGPDLDVKRCAAPIGAADRHARARGHAAHDEPSVGQSELHGPDAERLVRLHLHVTDPGLEPFAPQLDAIRTGVEFCRERRRPAVAAGNAHGGSRGFRLDGDPRPTGRELRRKCLPLAEARDAHVGLEVEVPLCVDAHGVVAGRESELARRSARRLAVDGHLARRREVDLQSSREGRQPVAQHLSIIAADRHCHSQVRVPRTPRHEFVIARSQQVARPEMQPGPATLEREAVRNRIDFDLHRRRREDEHGEHRQHARSKHGEHAPERPAAAGGSGDCGLRTERDRLDALVRSGSRSRLAQRLRRDRRRRDVAAPAGHDLEPALRAIEPQPQAAAAHVEHVAAAQPGRARDAGAVVQHGGSLVRGLEEELSVVQRKPGERTVDRCRNHDVAAGASDRQRKVLRRDRTFAERLQQREPGVQMRSSQRMTTAGGSRPGTSVSSRLTSRNPERVPTTV